MDYEDIITAWVEEFVQTMDHPDDLRPGNTSGDTPNGVKIIFDGWGEDENGEEIRQHMSLALFIHKDSLDNEFPEHDFTPWALIHRPAEEICFWVWWNFDTDSVDHITDIDDSSTELDHEFVKELIQKIWDRDHLED